MRPTVLATLLLMLSTIAVAQGRKVADPETVVKAHIAIQEYVRKDEQLKGGFFLLDPQKDTVRNLKLEQVHTEVDRMSANRYVSCVNFVDQNNNKLDVDFYLTPGAGNGLEVAKIKIHKVNGVKRK